jgi:hypothetical protein
MVGVVVAVGFVEFAVGSIQFASLVGFVLVGSSLAFDLVGSAVVFWAGRELSMCFRVAATGHFCSRKTFRSARSCVSSNPVACLAPVLNDRLTIDATRVLAGWSSYSNKPPRSGTPGWLFHFVPQCRFFVHGFGPSARFWAQLPPRSARSGWLFNILNRGGPYQ